MPKIKLPKLTEAQVKSLASSQSFQRGQSYYRNGSIYLVRRTAFEEQLSLMVKPTIPYIMPSDLLLNIDEPRDMIIAEALIPAWKKGLLG